MKKLVPLALLALLLSACASKDPVQTTTPVVERPTDTARPNPQPTTTPTNPTAVAGNPLRDPNNILSKRSVYFDYDSNVVKDEFRPLLQAHAKYLVDTRGAQVRIEGNTDERGSREYNLALGQRRAEAVKKVLTVLGVPESRIETVSFGEERPKNPGHDEAAWAQNRRGDVVYAGE